MIDIGFNRDRVSTDFFEVCGSQIKIIEEAESGKATLTCTFPNVEEREFIRILKEHDALLLYTKNKKCTDGIFIGSLVSDRKKANLYVFELKTSMDVSVWNHVKNQFRGATLRALAVASSMGICEIENIFYYTAYVDADELKKTAEDLKKKEKLEGIIRKKVAVGIKPKEVEEWTKRTITPFDEQPTHFPHHHVLMRRESGVNVGEVLIGV